MKFKVGDKVEFILESKKQLGTVEGVYNHTLECKVKIGESPTYVIKSQEYLVKFEEPKQLVVPRYVADWFEAHRYNLENNIWEYIREWNKQDCYSEFFKFMGRNSGKPVETLIKMQDGYEVEKEQLYYIKLPKPFMYLRRSKLYPTSQNIEDASMYSKKEIKEMDEGYLHFAIPIE
ncbi:gp31 [Listeria phage A511]|uniref:Gp31 n=1 Tax=Listeria phage A511 TaxID=2908169 RepID=A8AT55_BPA51|nr:gp31 [Listeria phage A511]AAY53002.1 gp31 [Listeria phage A511]